MSFHLNMRCPKHPRMQYIVERGLADWSALRGGCLVCQEIMRVAVVVEEAERNIQDMKKGRKRNA